MSDLRPENTIIVFDINGVLFNTDYRQLVPRLLRDKNTLRLIAHMFHPKVVWDVIKLYCKGSINEEYYAHLINTYPSLAACASLMVSAAACQKQIPLTIELVRTLKDQGYTLHILSNIGMLFFSELHYHHPHVFAHFEKARIACAAENYLSKPHKLMYQRYQQELNPEGKQVIFIDDKPKNVTAAHQEGMIGVLYKTPEKLKVDLSEILKKSL